MGCGCAGLFVFEEEVVVCLAVVPNYESFEASLQEMRFEDFEPFRSCHACYVDSYVFRHGFYNKRFTVYKIIASCVTVCMAAVDKCNVSTKKASIMALKLITTCADYHVSYLRGNVMQKIRRSITIDKELMDWINEQIKCKRFKDVSHAIEYSVYKLKKEDQNGK